MSVKYLFLIQLCLVLFFGYMHYNDQKKLNCGHEFARKLENNEIDLNLIQCNSDDKVCFKAYITDWVDNCAKNK